MSGYTKINLKDPEDMAVKYGHSPGMETRFARKSLELSHTGMTYQRLAPNHRIPFAHRHGEQEEVYLIIEGSGKAKLDDEIVELKRLDAVRVDPATVRSLEGGPDGMELIIFSDQAGNHDVELVKDWWKA